MFKHIVNITRDEIPVSSEMDGLSPLDGFAEITECLAEIVKYLANEPSVGLFYVQQHAKNTVPNLVNLKNDVKRKSRELTLQTEDADDSMTMVRSMKDSGFPIVDEMVKDITKSLAIMSAKEPRKGLINNSNSQFQPERTSYWGSATWHRKTDLSPQDSKSTSSYFTALLKSPQGRSSNMNWPQLHPSELKQTKDEELPSYFRPALPYAAAITSSADIEIEELPLSCQTAEELQEESQNVVNLTNNQISFTSDNFDIFKADREAKLEEWLGASNHVSHIRETTADNMTRHSDADEASLCK